MLGAPVVLAVDDGNECVSYALDVGDRVTSCNRRCTLVEARHYALPLAHLNVLVDNPDDGFNFIMRRRIVRLGRRAERARG